MVLLKMVIFLFIIQKMSNIRFTKLFLLCLFITAIVNSQNCTEGQLSFNGQCSSITYIEGCSIYNPDSSCKTCEYGYASYKSGCARNNNETADCCLSYNSDGSCQQCSNGLFYQDPQCLRNQIYGCIRKQGNSCTICGFGLTLFNGICIPKIPNCVNVSSNGECVGCSVGFSLMNSYCVEYPQVANCKVQNFYGCVQCADNYYLTASKICLPYEAGCLKYWQQKCLACHPLFYFVNQKCLIDGCQQYASNGCLKCYDGYTLENGKCSYNNCLKIVNGSCVQCKKQYRLSANGCVAPADYKCQTCQPGFVFVNGGCIKSIIGCTKYTTSNICASCKNNFQLTINGVCQILGCALYNDDGCTKCSSPFQLLNQICIIDGCSQYLIDGCSTCKDGYLLTSKQCVQKNPNCAAYSSDANGAQICSQCISKYYLLKGVCYKAERGCTYDAVGACKCSGKFLLSDKGKCEILGCSTYDDNDNCLTCNAPFSFSSGVCYINYCQDYTWSSCKTCQNGYILVNGLCQLGDAFCLSYNQQGACLSCQSGFILDSSYRCYKNILHCSYISSDRVTCKQCESGFILTTDGCKAALSNCVSQTSDTFLCLSCVSGFHLNKGLCVMNDPNCQTYAKQNSSEYCSICQNGYLLTSSGCVLKTYGCIYSNSTCVDCSKPFIYDVQLKSCFIPGCKSACERGCDTCNSPFLLQNGTCVINFCNQYDRNGCTVCQTGFKVAGGICVVLDANCAFYQGTQCTKCNSGYIISNGSCVIQDFNCDSFGRDGKCIRCKDICYFDEFKKCQPKENGCIYQNGKCKYCTTPFVYNQAKATCEITNCLETNPTGCLRCQLPFQLNNATNQCVIPNCQNVQKGVCVQCRPQYHLKKGTACIQDSSSCLSYNDDGNCQLCANNLVLTSTGDCSQSQSSCLQVCDQDKSKCLACGSGYFLNRFYQCEKKDGFCSQYINGVCSKCNQRYFLFSEICFPYTIGCVQYSGKDCTQCKKDYVLKNGQCFKWKDQGLKLLGTDDNYDFDITPIDVRQSKYYIDNLSPASAIGQLFFSSSFDSSYSNASLTNDEGSSGKGWKAKTADYNQFIGYSVSDQPATFYAVQLEAVQGNYITEFYIEYSVNGVDFIKVQNSFKVSSSILTNITTICFTGIYAKVIRVRITGFQGWPATRIEFFYYDLLRFKKISNLKSLKYLQETINSKFVDRVDNQIYINQVYFFNPVVSCTAKDLCFTGLELCQQRDITGVTLNFQDSNYVSEFYLTYSIDGRSFNCYKSCLKYSVSNVTNNSFNLQLDGLSAQGVRIYPTKYKGTPKFSPTFFYN